MATFVLLPGAGSDSWYWHLVVPVLEEAGHDVVAVDLPVTDDTAGFAEYADVVVDAIGDRRDVVLVAQSLSGFVAPLVCERVPVDAHGPGGGDGAAAGRVGRRVVDEHRARRSASVPTRPTIRSRSSCTTCPTTVAAESEHHVHPQSGTPFEDPWPLDAWPDVPTRFLLVSRRPLLPRRLPAPRRAGAPRDRARRDGRRPPAGARPSAGVGATAARIPGRGRPRSAVVSAP